jgi:sugar phosphate isomerase/epimerase
MQTNLVRLLIIINVTSGLFSCRPGKSNQPDMNNYFAWCIVPFDNQNRDPEERIEMLKRLGFKAYAYDWRAEHLSEMTKELKLAAENGIYVNAVWMWLDKNDSIGKLSANNLAVLRSLEESGLNTRIWISFPENYFDASPDSIKLRKATAMTEYLSFEAGKLGCKVGLYNHGGWFGHPDHLVEIIESLPGHDVGIIFNFHHAHEFLNDFDRLAKNMAPYLWAVNLNGMIPEGPKIVPLGQGTREKEMVRILKEQGFQGPYGILGHIPDADVEKILQANLDGLKKIF